MNALSIPRRSGWPLLVASIGIPFLLPLRAQQDTTKPWPVRRQEVERAWLDLLGDFPATIPAFNPTITKIHFLPGCPTERLSPEQLKEQKPNR